MPGDAGRCHEIESAAYQGMEAATRQSIVARIESYPKGFMVIEAEPGILGFINSASTDSVAMADEAFKDLVGHDPAGRHNVILSLAVRPDFQGLGAASILMRNCILRMRRLGKATSSSCAASDTSACTSASDSATHGPRNRCTVG